MYYSKYNQTPFSGIEPNRNNPPPTYIAKIEMNDFPTSLPAVASLRSTEKIENTPPPSEHFPTSLLSSPHFERLPAATLQSTENFDSSSSGFPEKRHTICIPRIHHKITKQYIFSIFCNLNVGFIERVIEIPMRHDAFHKRVIVKIKWNAGPLSTYILSRFDRGQNVKVMYSEPSYWICVPNYVRPLFSEQPYEKVSKFSGIRSATIEERSLSSFDSL